MRVAVLLPCYNEAAAIGNVVRSFQEALPEARIYVFDNNSVDDTARLAAEAGAELRAETRQGKGYVVQRMFADIDADIYLMADGDGTYHAPSAPLLIETLLRDRLDMVVACRTETEDEAYRPGHRLGNRVLTSTVQILFGRDFTDMLSGYRAFSRRYVKTFPVTSGGFEIETEMTIHALQMGMPCGEISTPYGARCEGSNSKLRTYRDGFRIMASIGRMLMTERPRLLFGTLAILLALSSVLLATPLIRTWYETGLVPRIPTAILCSCLGILSVLSLTFGWLMDNVTRARMETKRLVYLAMPALRPDKDNVL